MISSEYCKALEVRIFNKNKEVKNLRSQVFFFKLTTVLFVMLFLVECMTRMS